MYHVSGLSGEQQQFLFGFGSTNKSRAIETSIALGRALSQLCIMPSSPVENPSLYFKSDQQFLVIRLVDYINEVINVDVLAVLEYVAKFYQHRYYSLFPKNNVLCLNNETTLVDFFSISRSFDKETIAAITNGGIAISSLTNKFYDIVQTLNTLNKSVGL